MSYYTELELDIQELRKRTDINIDDLLELSALQERTRIFGKLRDLIQQKDSNNDYIAAEVLAWAWEELSQ